MRMSRARQLRKDELAQVEALLRRYVLNGTALEMAEQCVKDRGEALKAKYELQVQLADRERYIAELEREIIGD